MAVLKDGLKKTAFQLYFLRKQSQLEVGPLGLRTRCCAFSQSRWRVYGKLCVSIAYQHALLWQCVPVKRHMDRVAFYSFLLGVSV